MPPASATLFAQGAAALRETHGETLTYRSRNDVIGTEWGEALASEETGSPILAGNEDDVSFTCNWFDEFYSSPSPDGIGLATLRPACEVATSQLANPKRNDVIWRDGQAYVVQDVQPDGLGNNLLLLSKNVH